MTTAKKSKSAGKKVDVASKKTKAKKGKEKKSSKKEKVEVKTMNKFREYCYKNNITQKDIRDMTYLSIGTVNRLINLGKATKSMVLLVSYAMEIPEAKLIEMLKTDV